MRKFTPLTSICGPEDSPPTRGKTYPRLTPMESWFRFSGHAFVKIRDDRDMRFQRRSPFLWNLASVKSLWSKLATSHSDKVSRQPTWMCGKRCNTASMTHGRSERVGMGRESSNWRRQGCLWRRQTENDVRQTKWRDVKKANDVRQTDNFVRQYTYFKKKYSLDLLELENIILKMTHFLTLFVVKVHFISKFLISRKKHKFCSCNYSLVFPNLSNDKSYNSKELQAKLIDWY